MLIYTEYKTKENNIYIYVIWYINDDFCLLQLTCFSLIQNAIKVEKDQNLMVKK